MYHLSTLSIPSYSSSGFLSIYNFVIERNSQPDLKPPRLTEDVRENMISILVTPTFSYGEDEQLAQGWMGHGHLDYGPSPEIDQRQISCDMYSGGAPRQFQDERHIIDRFIEGVATYPVLLP